MGTEAAWVPLVMSAVAAGASEYNNRRTARKQDREIAQGIREQAQTRREATQKVNEVVDKTAESDASTFRDERMSSMQRAIAGARQKALNSVNQEGGISDTAAAYQGRAGTGATDYAGALAGLFSVMDAAGDQRLSERNLSGDANMDLARLSGDASQSEFLARLRANRHRPNPWINIGAAALSGAGQGIATGAFGGGGGSTHTPNRGPSYTGPYTGP